MYPNENFINYLQHLKVCKHVLEVYVHKLMNLLWFLKGQITDRYTIVYNENNSFICMKTENKHHKKEEPRINDLCESSKRKRDKVY